MSSSRILCPSAQSWVTAASMQRVVQITMELKRAERAELVPAPVAVSLVDEQRESVS